MTIVPRARVISAHAPLQHPIASSDNSHVRFFDKEEQFVLDSAIFSSIIYIWYEGGALSPPVVTLGSR
jgi:hypothetical protein